MPHKMVRRSERCVYFLFVRVSRFQEGSSRSGKEMNVHIHCELQSAKLSITFSIKSFGDLIVDDGLHAHFDEVTYVGEMKVFLFVVTQRI